MVFHPIDYDVRVSQHLESRCLFRDVLVSWLKRGERGWGPTFVLQVMLLAFLSPNLYGLGSDPTDSDALGLRVLHLPVLKV